MRIEDASALADILGPLRIADIPLDGRAECILETVAWFPTELALYTRVIDGIPPIVPGPVAHELDP